MSLVAIGKVNELTKKILELLSCFLRLNDLLVIRFLSIPCVFEVSSEFLRNSSFHIFLISVVLYFSHVSTGLGVLDVLQHIDVQRRQQAEHSRRAEEDTRKTSQPIRSRSRALSRKSASGLRELEAIALGNVPTVGSSDSLVDSDPSTSAGNADIFYSVDGSISSNRASVDDVKCLLLQVKDVVNTGYSVCHSPAFF